MPKKQSIESLMQKLEEESLSIESMENSLEDTLKRYEKTIKLSRELLSKIQQQKKSFDSLTKEAEQLITPND